MKLVDLNLNTYIKSSNEINARYPKLKIADIVRISKYENMFAKGYVPICSEHNLSTMWRGQML